MLINRRNALVIVVIKGLAIAKGHPVRYISKYPTSTPTIGIPNK